MSPMRRSIRGALAGLAVAGCGAHVQVGATYTPDGYGGYHVRWDPPRPRREYQPAPRRGYEWAAGYWRVVGSQWQWVAGHHVPARPGLSWAHATWELDPDGVWAFVPGHYVQLAPVPAAPSFEEGLPPPPMGRPPAGTPPPAHPNPVPSPPPAAPKPPA